jgi:hypothetical protein
MLHPVKHDRGPLTEHNGYNCPEYALGSYYSGPTRISLLDTAASRVLNTLKLSYENQDSYDVPYRISPEFYYRVTGPLRQKEGRSELLHLLDYNGDGEALEAAFYSREGCQGLNTTLIGYSKRQDAVIQFRLELTEGRTKSFQKWVDYLFHEKPLSPRRWKYEIDSRARGGTLDQYDIRYDSALERFYGTLKSVRIP